MITAIFIAIVLLTITADWIAYNRGNRHIVIAILLIILNLIPILSASLMALCRDNSHLVMSICAWALTIYTIATATRIGLYFGLAVSRRRWLGAVLSIAILGILTNGLINTRTALTVKNITINHSTLPESFDGFRIALFSDLHIGSMLNPEKEITRLVDKINSLDADIVIFAGDMQHIRHTELNETISDILSTIKARHGVYAVLGNHDTGTYIKDTTTLSTSENIARFNTKIGQIGWHMLRDSTIYVTEGQDSIAITGIDFTDALLEYKHSFVTPDNFSAAEIFEKIPDSLFNIAISHLPQLWQPICEQHCAELTLSGHVHATQIAVDIFGTRLSPAMLLHKQWSGLYKSTEGEYLYITDGIGCVGFNMRIGARPEISLLELSR